MRDVKGALAWQAALVAGACVVADAGIFLIAGPPLDDWRVWTVFVATVLADAALAGPARLSGWVAVAHAMVLTVSPLLLPWGHTRRSMDNAGVLIAGYRAGAWLRTGQAAVAVGALVSAVVACHLIAGNVLDWRLLVLNALTSGLLPWLVGRYTTARRGHIADVERREAEAVRRAVAEERSAIARDLHDVISHHVSAIGVHAGAARLGLAEQDTPVWRSLSAVESATRASLADLRRLLDLLHGQDADARRQPGLENLGALLDGLPARLTVEGKRRDLPGSMDIALYRVAQEALTNALRHGDGGTVEVELVYGEAEVVLTVTNAVKQHGRRTGEQHHGLAGIVKRVALYGGRLSYGPDGPLWRLCAAFPVPLEAA